MFHGGSGITALRCLKDVYQWSWSRYDILICSFICVLWFDKITARCRYNVVKFLLNPLKRHPYSPIRARYGVPFVCLNSDLYSSSVTAGLYAISYCIGSRYNGIWLFLFRHCIVCVVWREANMMSHFIQISSFYMTHIVSINLQAVITHFANYWYRAWW